MNAVSPILSAEGRACDGEPLNLSSPLPKQPHLIYYEDDDDNDDNDDNDDDYYHYYYVY